MKTKIFNFIGELIIRYIFWRERKGGNNSVICIKRKNGAEQVIKVFSKQAYANVVYPALHKRWTPVTKRPPEDTGYYLTTTMYDEVYCDYWDGVCFNRTEEVIAWMPKPEPYKAERTDPDMRVTIDEAYEAIQKLTTGAGISQEDIESSDFPVYDLAIDEVISRQQALKELKESAEHHANDSREEVLLRRDRDIIRALPPVTPQEKIGHWIAVGDYFWKCSECRCCEIKKSDWCPSCGAMMQEVEE